jgi:hypothetical protein
MTDGRRQNGGARPGAGRKAKALEDDLNQRIEAALKDGRKSKLNKILAKLVEDSLSTSFRTRNEARKTLLAYRYGKPGDRQQTTGSEREDLAPPIADAIDRIYGTDDTDAGS